LSTATAAIPAGLERHDPTHVATYLALMRFAEQGVDSPTLQQLIAALGVSSPSTIVRRLNAMESAGLIRKHPWEGVRRVKYELLLGR
jgi:DNA-binding MarR family transcriptional regulator